MFCDEPDGVFGWFSVDVDYIINQTRSCLCFDFCVFIAEIDEFIESDQSCDFLDFAKFTLKNLKLDSSWDTDDVWDDLIQLSFADVCLQFNKNWITTGSDWIQNHIWDQQRLVKRDFVLTNSKVEGESLVSSEVVSESIEDHRDEELTGNVLDFDG